MISLGSFVLLLGRPLFDDLQHLLLNLLLLQHKSVFIPDEVRLLDIKIVPLHAAFPETDDVRIIWVLGEAKSSAVVHELPELLRLVLAEFFDGHFLLLLLDVGVLLLLGSAWETLPW